MKTIIFLALVISALISAAYALAAVEETPAPAEAALVED